MRTLISIGKAVVCLAAAPLIAACSTHSPEKPTTATAAVGKVGMDLRTVSASGKVYRLRQAVLPVTALDTLSNVVTLNSEDNPDAPVAEAFLAPNGYQIQLLDGWFLEEVDPLLNETAQVQATLVSGQFQFFQIQSNQETFIQFQFQVNGETVTFAPPGRLIVGIGVQEQEGGTSPSGLNARRVLLESNQKALNGFTLEQALQAAQTNSGVTPDPVSFYQQIIDTYASKPNATLPGGEHCGDEQTNGAPSLNGYPLRCDRLEHQQIDNIGQWFPIAAVNRLDLAPQDGENCGEQRMIFANNAPIGNSRMFMILEAQIPNPNPACGVQACRPIADFWAAQNTVADPATRGASIMAAFETGSPTLSAAGFKPFLSIENMSIGAGSIRTNNFDDDEWTLREFKPMTDPLGQTRAVEFPDDQAPHGELWNDTSTLPEGAGCRQSFLDALSGLLSDNPAEMAFVVDQTCLDSESPNDFTTENYPQHLANGSGTFRSQLVAKLAGTGLTPENIAARAQFAGSCMGCHEEANGVDLGHGVTSPSSNGFVQVDEQFTEDCGDGTQCFAASPALTQVFLPRRMTALNDLLSLPATCGTVDGGTAPPPTSGDAGVAPAPPISTAGDGGLTVLTPNETLGTLVKQDQASRAGLQGQTLGGQPAKATH